MSMKGLAALSVLLILAACGTETDDPEPRAKGTPAAAPMATPTEVPVPTGQVRTEYAVMVIDDGDGAELCLGGTLDSLPPQCSGPKLLGWAWAGLEGAFDERDGTRWGAFAVTGTFDGKNLTPTDVVPADEFDEPEYEDPYDRTTTCPEPEGGWRVLDPATTTQKTEDAAIDAAQQLEEYAGAWVDQSINPAYYLDDPYAMEEKLNDPTLLVLNIQVTEDPAGVEAALREIWGGALCVTQVEHTERELLQIQKEIRDLPGMLGGGTSANRVLASVVYDDGSMQAWADQEYGVDAVSLSSALVPAE